MNHTAKPEVSKLFAKHSLNFKSYAPIEPPAEISKRLGIPENEIIKMDANENPYGVPPAVLQALVQSRNMHIYPDPEQRKARQLIADYCGATPEQIVVGNGSDELLDLICRAFLEPDEGVLVFTPSFSYYGHVVRLSRGRLLEAPRDSDFNISLGRLNEQMLGAAKIVLLCSPNNPTGNMVSPDVVDFFLQRNMIVVVDEAYFEFAGQTYISLIHKHPNLIVLRTLSKMFALAGFRIGYGIMHEQTAQTFMAIKPPYSVSVPSEVALEAALDNLALYEKQVDEMKGTREFLMSRLSQFNGLQALPSKANFFLVKAQGKMTAAGISAALEKKGILVRRYSTPELEPYFRVSVPTPQQAVKLLQSIGQILGQPVPENF